ncbi:hypothetical protein EA473_11240 [Natrarchaeobius chitinivorans]|uniref:Uncharacterized protein n=1 Tax=Natrarchaeobius chitinivorans TaxID=1679083 RepID=A0A3N6LVU9_NATCH|nr:hypothetical protein EA473_11240 [Natrarchaeobius chitinivorans]
MTHPSRTVGQNYLKIGRSPAAVSDGDGREFAIDVSLTSVRQYHTTRSTRSERSRSSTASGVNPATVSWKFVR